jgi:hypothetical protein
MEFHTFQSLPNLPHRPTVKLEWACGEKKMEMTSVVSPHFRTYPTSIALPVFPLTTFPSSICGLRCGPYVCLTVRFE